MSYRKTRYKFSIAYHPKKYAKNSVMLNRELCPRCEIFMDIVAELRKNDGDSTRGIIWKCRRCRQTFLGKAACPNPT